MRDFQRPGRSTVYAQNGVCATSHPLGAKVAIQMLEVGGNAVDAAIAGAVVLGLCEPAMTGIGGDMFAIIKPAHSEDLVGINASGRAPKAASAEGLRAKGLDAMDPDAAHSVVVPAAIRGFERLANDYGKAGLAACLAPAIRYADEGVPVAPRAAFDWALAESRLRGAARKWYLTDNRPPAPGSLFRHSGQAEVLRRIAKDGSDAFYTGEVADDMVTSLSNLGGVHSLEDFASCEADYVVPISVGYRDTEIVELPPNGHGAAALLMARLVERFELSDLDPLGAERAHLEIEAAKLAYAARNQAIGDPDYMTMNVKTFLSDSVVTDLAGRIDPNRAMNVPTDPIGEPHRETIYITVVDRDRMAVSLIYSVFKDFGSALASDKFGINFNDRAAGFVLTPGHPNEFGPNKRPLHTIIPGMLRENGRITMPFGVMGGAYQCHGHVRLISNLVDYGMDVQAAIDAPRLFQEHRVVDVESGYADDVSRRLEELGHRTGPCEVAIGGAQAIQIDHDRGVLIAGSDPRKDGIALGY